MYRIGAEEIEELKKVIEAGDLFKINGGLQESGKVEQKLKDTFACRHSIFMTSGHAALVSALIAMGIGPGDEVIVPAYTYISTAMAVVAAGAMPVIAEVDDTLTISPEDIKTKITKNTKAIMPVHIQGFPCNMDAIMEIAKTHNLFVLEDACQADGGSFKGKRLGTIGDAGTLSFNFFKIISSGEGGALLTDNRQIFERALIYQDSSAVAFFGNQLEGFTEEGFCGNEYRSNELCAAVMNVQLDRLDGILADLRKNKKYLMDALADVAEFIPSNDILGDCGTTLAIRFESEEKARAFATAEGVRGILPIDTGKHIYKHWTPIMEKRGAFHPLMDPFKMEANKDIVPDYRADMCPATLERLAKVVYISVSPNVSKEKWDQRIEAIKKALATI
ncbi:MAG: aminotransferase class I/II-fold pyridoxal phosphate-dependent enzyme [Oscillospiraceae bacterium]|nr:aminotransferase class I/II-fold pyridoxal phosphate-dependent enzyme [Oscillospiraceae bacterium]